MLVVRKSGIAITSGAPPSGGNTSTAPMPGEAQQIRPALSTARLSRYIPGPARPTIELPLGMCEADVSITPGPASLKLIRCPSNVSAT